jgi:hypothetical protein
MTSSETLAQVRKRPESETEFIETEHVLLQTIADRTGSEDTVMRIICMRNGELAEALRHSLQERTPGSWERIDTYMSNPQTKLSWFLLGLEHCEKHRNN